MTWVTSSMSIPRAATSVRRGRRCCRFETLSDFSRAIWPRSPCNGADLESAFAQLSATFCAVRLVRVKIMVAPRPSACRMRLTISTLSRAWAR